MRTIQMYKVIIVVIVLTLAQLACASSSSSVPKSTAPAVQLKPTNAPTAQPASPTAAPKVASTATRPNPTATPKIDSTASPTLQPTPKPLADLNPALALPFSDNFDNGIGPLWRVVKGKPLGLNGKLTAATDNLTLEIGNKALNSYTLELDISGKDPAYCGFGYSNYLKLGVSPNLMFQFSYYSYGRGEWITFDGREWKNVSTTDSLKCGRLRIVVNGKSYKAYINSQLVSELILDQAEGPLVVSIDEGVVIDNVSIK